MKRVLKTGKMKYPLFKIMRFSSEKTKKNLKNEILFSKKCKNDIAARKKKRENEKGPP